MTKRVALGGKSMLSNELDDPEFEELLISMGKQAEVIWQMEALERARSNKMPVLL